MREEDVCAFPRRNTVARTLTRWSEWRRSYGELDFWCIGVLIPTLNYPLSWAQLGPLVKTPPLFVLRSR